MMRYRLTTLTVGPPDETAAPACRKAETPRGTARYHNALAINVFLDWHSLCYYAEHGAPHCLSLAKARRHRRTGESERGSLSCGVAARGRYGDRPPVHPSYNH